MHEHHDFAASLTPPRGLFRQRRYGMTNASRLLVRRLWSSDVEALRRHLLRLSPTDRTDRFCAHMADDAVVAYAGGINWEADRLVGAFVGGHLRGIAELRRPGNLADSGEVALSVESRFQGAGIGTTLFDCLHRTARNAWMREMCFLCQRGNRRIQRIGRRLGAALEDHGGEVQGRLRLWPPTPLSLLAEGGDELLALMATA